jgi:hypothetical protein
VEVARFEAAKEYGAKQATAELLTMLADPIHAVRMAALDALGEHPLARSIRDYRAALLSVQPKTTDEWGFGPTGPYLGLDGKPVAYPVPGAALSGLEKIPEKSHASVSIIDVADDAKAKCKICKAAIDVGQPRLVVPATERDDDFFHLECAATKKKLAAPLDEARRRSRTG